jgi:short-subunit dehydrogenase
MTASDRDPPSPGSSRCAQSTVAARPPVITGASSGSAPSSRASSPRGSHVILVTRRRERLNELAAELSAAHGVRATAISLDLSLPAAGQTLAERVASATA